MQNAIVPSTTSNEAKGLLVAFAQSVASRPFDLDRIQQAGKRVQETMGEGALIEAACSVGGMEIATRIVGSTRKRKPPRHILMIASIVFTIFRWIMTLFSSWFR
jgi:hypothetical protein